MITALIPYFGGVGEAAPSEAANRPGYLLRTIASLSTFADHIIVGVCDGERALPSVKTEVRSFDCKPQHLPSTMLRWAQSTLPPTQVYLTEADQILHYDPAVLEVVSKGVYLVPHRLEQLGPGGEGSRRGMMVDFNEERWVLTNGVPARRHYEFYHPANFVLQYGGAYLASWDLFRSAKFPDRDIHPVEHATGFDISRYGFALKTGNWQRFFVEHLSGYEYHERGGGRV